MRGVKYSSDSMKLITLFESITGAEVKDCISNDKLIFIIRENEMGKAIGKKGANVKKIEDKLRKKIKLVEFTNDVAGFVKNLIYPIEVQEINFDNGVVTIRGKDSGSKAMLVGRDRQNIMHLSDIVGRYFDVREIRVI